MARPEKPTRSVLAGQEDAAEVIPGSLINRLLLGTPDPGCESPLPADSGSGASPPQSPGRDEQTEAQEEAAEAASSSSQAQAAESPKDAAAETAKEEAETETSRLTKLSIKELKTQLETQGLTAPPGLEKHELVELVRRAAARQAEAAKAKAEAEAKAAAAPAPAPGQVPPKANVQSSQGQPAAPPKRFAGPTPPKYPPPASAKAAWANWSQQRPPAMYPDPWNNPQAWGMPGPAPGYGHYGPVPGAKSFGYHMASRPPPAPVQRAFFSKAEAAGPPPTQSKAKSQLSVSKEISFEEATATLQKRKLKSVPPKGLQDEIRVFCALHSLPDEARTVLEVLDFQTAKLICTNLEVRARIKLFADLREGLVNEIGRYDVEAAHILRGLMKKPAAVVPKSPGLPPKSQTPLLKAAEHGHLEMAKRLVGRGKSRTPPPKRRSASASRSRSNRRGHRRRSREHRSRERRSDRSPKRRKRRGTGSESSRSPSWPSGEGSCSEESGGDTEQEEEPSQQGEGGSEAVPGTAAAPEVSEEERQKLAAWLTSLDGGRGAAACYLEPLLQEFGGLENLTAALLPDKPDGTSLLEYIDPAFWEVLGSPKMGHKLLLARGIVQLSSATQ